MNGERTQLGSFQRLWSALFIAETTDAEDMALQDSNTNHLSELKSSSKQICVYNAFAQLIQKYRITSIRNLKWPSQYSCRAFQYLNCLFFR